MKKAYITPVMSYALSGALLYDETDMMGGNASNETSDSSHAHSKDVLVWDDDFEGDDYDSWGYSGF